MFINLICALKCQSINRNAQTEQFQTDLFPLSAVLVDLHNSVLNVCRFDVKTVCSALSYLIAVVVRILHVSIPKPPHLINRYSMKTGLTMDIGQSSEMTFANVFNFL